MASRITLAGPKMASCCRLRLRFCVDCLNTPTEVGSLDWVLALFQGYLKFAAHLRIAIEFPVAASQCQGGNGCAAFASTAEQLDRPVVHPAKGIPLSKSRERKRLAGSVLQLGLRYGHPRLKGSVGDAASEVPELERERPGATREHRAAVRRNRQDVDGHGLFGERAQLPTGGEIPELQSLSSTRERSATIEHQRQALRCPADGAQLFSAGQVPELQCRVPTRRKRGLPQSGAMAMLVTRSEWPANVCNSFPLARSQSFRVASQLAESAVCPSGAMATLVTRSEWPVKVRSSFPLVKSQSFKVLSPLPESAVRPSGAMAMLVTEAWCPTKVRNSLPLARSQSVIVS